MNHDEELNYINNIYTNFSLWMLLEMIRAIQILSHFQKSHIQAQKSAKDEKPFTYITNFHIGHSNIEICGCYHE